MENERVHAEQLEIGDAFGEVLLACQDADGAGCVAYEIVERSDGFLGVVDAATYFSTEADFAFDLSSGRVLDIGAGAGRASIALQDRGQDVVALDISAGATAVCRSRGVRTTFTGSVFELAASRPHPFDTFLMLGNNLGLLGGQRRPRWSWGARRHGRFRGANRGGDGRPVHDDGPTPPRVPPAEPEVGTTAGTVASAGPPQADGHVVVDYLLCTPEEIEEVIASTAWSLVGAEPRPRPSGQWVATLMLSTGSCTG